MNDSKSLREKNSNFTLNGLALDCLNVSSCYHIPKLCLFSSTFSMYVFDEKVIYFNRGVGH